MEELTILPGWRVLIHVARYFFNQFITLKGYKDGKHGFVMASLDSFYIMLNHLKVWEKVEGLKKFHDDERDKCDLDLQINSLTK